MTGKVRAFSHTVVEYFMVDLGGLLFAGKGAKTEDALSQTFWVVNDVVKREDLIHQAIEAILQLLKLIVIVAVLVVMVVSKGAFGTDYGVLIVVKGAAVDGINDLVVKTATVVEEVNIDMVSGINVHVVLDDAAAAAAMVGIVEKVNVNAAALIGINNQDAVWVLAGASAVVGFLAQVFFDARHSTFCKLIFFVFIIIFFTHEFGKLSHTVWYNRKNGRLAFLGHANTGAGARKCPFASRR